MNMNIYSVDGTTIAEVSTEGVAVNDVRDALDLIANANVEGANRIIIYAHQLPDAFFSLSTGMAGEILQKCANYRVKLAVVGDFSHHESRSLRAFIAESNRGNLAFFVANREAAIARLAR